MSARLKLLLESLHDILNIGATDALTPVLDLKSCVTNLNDHELGKVFKYTIV